MKEAQGEEGPRDGPRMAASFVQDQEGEEGGGEEGKEGEKGKEGNGWRRMDGDGNICSYVKNRNVGGKCGGKWGGGRADLFFPPRRHPCSGQGR